MTNATWNQKEVLISRTFTVSCISIELEAGLAQAQERAHGVYALASDAHVIFAALVHVWVRQKWEREADKLGESVDQDLRNTLINSNYPHRSSVFIKSTGSTTSSCKQEKECAIKSSSEHKTRRPFGALNGIFANRKRSKRRDLPRLFGLRTFPPDSLELITNPRCLISCRWVDNCSITA